MDLCHPVRLEAKLRKRIDAYNRNRPEGAEILNADEQWADLKAAAEVLAPLVTDTVYTVNEAVAAGKNLLFEGAQGTYLDIDFGTYPFVTSSNTTAGGAATGGGLAPNKIERVIGVAKAYTTRVGEGPFPTELHGEEGEALRKAGNEFGATTGRPRRCGWFDAVATRYAVMVNGITDLAVTKLDVLDHMDEISIGVAYRLNGELTDRMPADTEDITKAEPVYETMPGWKSSTEDAQHWDDLPEAAQNYLSRLSELCGAHISIISTGPARSQTFSN